MLYFTSDLHLGHSNVIRYSNRPFDSVVAMNKGLVERYNEVVTERDEVWWLGDVAFNRRTIDEMLPLFSGKKHLLLGNHDRRLEKYLEPHFLSVGYYKELRIQHPFTNEKLLIVLCHYPFASWNRSHYGMFHLHGHCHNNYKPQKGMILDIGVDGHEWYPWSLYQVCEYMKTREISVVDHHDPANLNETSST